jgi:hypothetical protein
VTIGALDGPRIERPNDHYRARRRARTITVLGHHTVSRGYGMSGLSRRAFLSGVGASAAGAVLLPG